MKCKGVIILLLTQTIWANFLFGQEAENGFSKKQFYHTMATDNADSINAQLVLLKAAGITQKKAYEGALLMRLAGASKGAKKKLDLFKEGHKKLEEVLNKDSSNTEYRFLRLMVQEHSPGILGYKNDMQKDRDYIKSNYKKLPPVVQAAVTDYSKTSKILKPADL